METNLQNIAASNVRSDSHGLLRLKEAASIAWMPNQLAQLLEVIAKVRPNTDGSYSSQSFERSGFTPSKYQYIRKQALDWLVDNGAALRGAAVDRANGPAGVAYFLDRTRVNHLIRHLFACEGFGFEQVEREQVAMAVAMLGTRLAIYATGEPTALKCDLFVLSKDQGGYVVNLSDKGKKIAQAWLNVTVEMRQWRAAPYSFRAMMPSVTTKHPTDASDVVFGAFVKANQP